MVKLIFFKRSAVADRGLSAEMGRGTWATIVDGRTDAKGGSSADASSQGGVMMVGVDQTTDGGWTFGAALGTDRADVASRGATADLDGVVGAVTAARTIGATRLAFGAVHTRSDVETERSVTGSTFNETLDANTDATTTQLFVEATRSWQKGATTITPHVGLAHAWTRVDGFTETGGLSALSVDSMEAERTTASVGVRMEREVRVGSTPVRVWGGLAYEHRFGDRQPVGMAAFAGSDAFQVQAPGSSRAVGHVDLGVEMRLAPTATVSATYSGAFGADGDDSAVGVGIKIAF